MLGGVAAAVICLLIDTTTIQPISQDRIRIEGNIKRATQENESLHREIQALKGIEQTAEERRIAAEKAQLLRQLEEIDAQLRSEISALVPPEAIVSVLEELLDESSGLELVRLRAHEPRRIGSKGDPEVDRETSARAGRLYRHRLTLEITGGFAATLDYLQRIEASDWHLLWDRFELRVEQFPKARITIDLHTISETEEWIGV